MSVYGYSRKNYPVPLIQQLTSIQGYGCDEIYVEEEELREDCEFRHLINEVAKDGDVLVVESLRVFRKSLKQLLPYLELMAAKNIRLVAVTDKIDTLQDNLAFFFLVSCLGQMDRDYHADIMQKNREGMAARGPVHGRPRIAQEKIIKINYLRREEGYSVREIAKICRVSVGTVHKYLKVQEDSKK